MSIVDAAKKAIEETKKKRLLPTYEVHFFCKEGAERMDWFAAEDEDDAKAQCKNDHKGCAIYYVGKSARTLEEIEALD